jgi:hypothetical protein
MCGLGMSMLAACERAPTEPVVTTTSPSESTCAGERREVLRIDQDLHPDDDYEIVVDAWVVGADELLDVRMTWIDTANADRRSPFGRGVRRHLELEYGRRDSRRWTVRLGARDRVWAIEIAMDATGSVGAFADVRAAGTILERCRIQRGALESTKLLGLPVGLDRIVVACIDAAGREHEGELVETEAR